MDKFNLNANDFFWFGNVTPGFHTYTPECPLTGDPRNQYAFMFYWTDLSFLEGGTTYYAYFEGGGSNPCPYSLKSAEPCLVVSFINATMNDGNPVGNINAVLFASGDMLSQVYLFPDAEWGEAGIDVSVGFGAVGAPLNDSQLSECIVWVGATRWL